MMRSEKSLKLLDLDGDLATTAGDIRALREVHRESLQDLKSYLEFLSCFPNLSESALSERKGPAGSKPFELQYSGKKPS